MIPSQFDYVAPESVEQALAAIAEAGDDGKVLAGGQSLLPILRLRMNSPETVIDLGRIADLAPGRGDRVRIRLAPGVGRIDHDGAVQHGGVEAERDMERDREGEDVAGRGQVAEADGGGTGQARGERPAGGATGDGDLEAAAQRGAGQGAADLPRTEHAEAGCAGQEPRGTGPSRHRHDGRRSGHGDRHGRHGG